MCPRIVEIRQKVLKKNDELARRMRGRFVAERRFTINLVSSPGSGKTALLERTLAELQQAGHAVAALVGDLETDHDARRLARSGAPVKQINTHGCCHLEAEMVRRHLEDWDLPGCRFLFIENVGNLVCTASYDLGESLRVVLLCVTEGEDKPLKYPGLFNSADVAVITKIDLAAACEFDRDVAYANVHTVRPGMRIFETSSTSGQGIADWVRWLCERRQTWVDQADR